MSPGEKARGVEGNRVVVDNHLSCSREIMEGDSADHGAGAGVIDSHMWLRRKITHGAHIYSIEDSGFVRAQDFNASRRIGYIDVEEARG